MMAVTGDTRNERGCVTLGGYLKRVLLALTMAPLLILAAGPIRADDGPIQVVSSSVTSEFPDGV